MKKISLGLAMLALSLVACNNNKGTDTTTNTTDSTTITTTDTMNANGGNTTGDANTNSGGTESSNMNGGNSDMNNSNNVNGSGNNMNGNGANGTNAGMSKKDSAGFATSGEYNSDKSIPKPVNTDDKRFRKHPPAHSYGDTAPKARIH